MNKANEILKTHGLDFTIDKEQLVGKDSGRITPYFGLFNSNTDECINTCKVGYHVSQNSDILNMVLKGISKFGDKLTVSKAGSINGGRRVFLQLAIEGKAKIGNDTVTKYVTILDSNDGSTALSVGIGDEVARCTNQFFRFYKAGEAKFRHAATLEEKIKSIPDLIEIALDKSLEQMKIYKKFLSTPLTQELARKVIDEVMELDTLLKINGDGFTKRQLDIYEALNSSIEQEVNDCGENVWGLFNGVTRFTTHHQKVPKRANGREESLINGRAYAKAMNAFNVCLEAV